MIAVALIAVALAFYCLGVLTSGRVLRLLDGTREPVPPSPAPPTPRAVDEATVSPHERLVRDGPGISPESIDRGMGHLRDLYEQSGRPVPPGTQLRAEALRALLGEDI